MRIGAQQVGIFDSAVLYRRGLALALTEAGLEAVEPTDAAKWLGEGLGHLALVSVRSPTAHDLISELAAALPVVALVPGAQPSHCWRAIRVGASGAIDWDADPDSIVAVVRHALSGSAVLPVEVIRWLADRASLPAEEGPQVSLEEVGWLGMLADGHTVAELADEVGYSERTMFRRLDEIYGRLGASNRREAMNAAQRFRLLADDDGSDEGAGSAAS